MNNLFDKDMMIEIVDEFIANLKKEAFRAKDVNIRNDLFDILDIINGFEDKEEIFDVICAIYTMIGVQNEQKTI